jgi:DNA-binding transcriptional LysR family regulator
MVPANTPAGRRVLRGPVTLTFHEVLRVIAAGEAVCPLNAHTPRYYTPPGIAYVPLHDAPATEWALIWRTSDENARLRAFVETARDFGTRDIGDRRR